MRQSKKPPKQAAVMSLQHFAERTRARIRRDGCADLFIPGKFGHLYEHDSGVFGVTLEDSWLRYPPHTPLQSATGAGRGLGR